MGDMADFANDACMDDVIQLHEHRDNGFPCNQETYEDGLIDEMGVDTFSDIDFSVPRGSQGCFVPVQTKPKFITCKHCGFTRLKWKETEEGWRLAHPDGELHECQEFFDQDYPEEDDIVTGLNAQD